MFDLEHYRDMFFEESDELFDTIDAILLEVEECGELDEDCINPLFRALHTLKGNSASVELHMFASLAHELEFFIDKLRKGELPFEPSMAGILIEGVDTLKEILELEVDEALEDDHFGETKQSLLNKLSCFSKHTKLNPLVNGDLEEIVEAEEHKEVAAEDDSFGFFDDTPAAAQTSSDDDSFGFFDDEVAEPAKADEDEGFGFFDEEPKPSVAKEEDEGFGFFDDEPAESVTASSQDEGFGFFDDTPAPSAEPAQHTEDEGFGFFDDEPSPAPLKAAADEGFGFFDETPAEPAQQNVTQTKTESKPEPVVQSPSEEKVTAAVADTPKASTSKRKSSRTGGAKEKSASRSIRVNLDKIDDLMNNIGELVITHSMLMQYSTSIEDPKVKADLQERFSTLDRHIRELQESVMSVRMVPMETVFSKFPKVVRDTASKIDKKVNYVCSGEGVEIDKAMIEGLTDPLMHIVRNAIDHGIEKPDVRKAAGKSETGTLSMRAEQANGQMIIKIQDDGAGINLERVCAKAMETGFLDERQVETMSKEEKAMLIFSPGLSTAAEVTDLSGRGVGMDVVMSNIKKLGGAVNVDTEQGIGTTIAIALPLTLAILDGLNVRIGDKEFILPLSVIIETIHPHKEMIKHVGDESSHMLMLREEFIPIVRMHEVFNITPPSNDLCEGILIIVRSATRKVAITIDEFMDQQQFVIKPLDKNFRNARGIGGATVRGDGSIGLIIDTMNLMQNSVLT